MSWPRARRAGDPPGRARRASRLSRWARQDRGSASIWVLAAGLLVILLGLMSMGIGRAVVAAHRAQIAADLGALAGAGMAQLGAGMACARAETVVAANGGQMSACALDGFDVIVTVRIPISAGPVRGAAVASARAGPERTGRRGRRRAGANQAGFARCDSTTSSTLTASALASGSFPLPHFGDCTHDGQPCSHPHAVIASRVAESHRLATW